jgi:ribosomal protein S18 acetylase RimI-like enzyme
MLRFRRAIADDTESILQLWKAAGSVPSVTDTPDDVCRMVAIEHAAFILALHDDAIIGSIIAAFDGWRGNIYRLSVHPQFRRRGIGRALLAEAEKVFAQWRVKRISALVMRDHPWAMGFWQAAGYVLDDQDARFHRDR